MLHPDDDVNDRSPFTLLHPSRAFLDIAFIFMDHQARKIENAENAATLRSRHLPDAFSAWLIFHFARVNYSSFFLSYPSMEGIAFRWLEGRKYGYRCLRSQIFERLLSRFRQNSCAQEIKGQTELF